MCQRPVPPSSLGQSTSELTLPHLFPLPIHNPFTLLLYPQTSHTSTGQIQLAFIYWFQPAQGLEIALLSQHMSACWLYLLLSHCKCSLQHICYISGPAQAVACLG